MISVSNNCFAVKNLISLCNNLQLDKRNIFNQLQDYVTLIKKWQQKINLVSVYDLDNLYYRHIYNSLHLLPYILQLQQANNFNFTITNFNYKIPLANKLTIADMGSGAGFPAIILAIFNTHNKYYLFETNIKKCAFLNTVIGTLQLTNVFVINNTANEISKYCAPNIIIARGLSNLTNLVKISLNEINTGAYGLFLKTNTNPLELKTAIKTYPDIHFVKLKNILKEQLSFNWQINMVYK